MELTFKIIVLFTCAQRLAELYLAKRNEKHILDLGGVIIKEKNYLFMVLLHSLWLLSIFYYSFFTEITISLPLFFGGLIFFVVGQTLRISAIATLGKRWSTRIVILPEAPAVKKGIYNYFRHPNYLGVVIEIAALPLMASLFNVALVFSLANFVILYFRIKLEEHHLIKNNDYRKIFELKG